MDIDRNAPCPCDSGKKLKHCCLDEHVAWHRAGHGILAYDVVLKDGSRCPVIEWDRPIDAKTTLVAVLNPVTSSWVRHTLPSVARFGHPGYRELLLKHLEAMAGGILPVGVAEEVADEFAAARDYLTFELARPIAPNAPGAAREDPQGASRGTHSRTAVGATARQAKRRGR